MAFGNAVVMGFSSEGLVKWINSYFITCCLWTRTSFLQERLIGITFLQGQPGGSQCKDFPSLSKLQALLSFPSSEEPPLILSYNGFFRDSHSFTETSVGGPAFPSSHKGV